MRRALLLVLLLLVPLILAGGQKKFVRVEDQMTDGAAGTVPVANGTGGLSMVDGATQAELDAAALNAERLEGEYAQFIDENFASTTIDLNDVAENWMPLSMILSEDLDRTGSWQIRSEGDDWSADWVHDSVTCWEPSLTWRVWLKNYCAGDVSSSTHSPGRPCVDSGDCGATQACNEETWDYGQTPNRFDVQAHGLGADGSTYPYLLGFDHGGPYPRDGGGGHNFPTGCSDSVVLADGDKVWAYVEDSNTLVLYKDDGDGTAEIGSGGPPPTGGEDKALDCTAYTGNWQTMLLRGLAADGSERQQYFRVSIVGGFNIQDASSPLSTAYANTLTVGAAVGAGPFEAVKKTTGVAAVCAPPNYKTVRWHGDYIGSQVTGICLMEPGDCLAAMGYVSNTTNDELDRLGAGGGSIVVSEVSKGSPIRNACAYTALTNSVGTSCMEYAMLSNAGATGNVELDLPSFEAGWDFCVTNVAAGNHTLNIDPNLSERFIKPATNNDGDSMQSVLQGETLCAVVLSDGEAQVTHNTGGWTDAD